MILHEQRKEREDLWLEAAGCAIRTQFHRSQIQLEGAEPVDHTF
jgi:hypothetical protein